MKIGLLASARNRHTHMWARWLADRGHEVVLFSDLTPRDDMNYDGIDVRAPEWTLWRNIVTFKLRGGPHANNRDKWKAWQRQILDIAPDVLHAHEALAYGPTLAHFPQFPRVLTPWGPEVECLAHVPMIHNPEPFLRILPPWGPKGERMLNAFELERRELVRTALQSADIVSTNGPGLEAHWSQLTGLPEDRFRMFSWGVDTSCFTTVPTELDDAILQRFPGIEPRRFLLSPRLANAYYGIEAIISGWKQWTAASPGHGMKLLILRAGAQSDPWLSWQVLAAGDDSIVVHEDYFAPAEMAALCRLSRGVIMLPETDLLAMSLLEAIACGALPLLNRLPAYGSAVGGLDATQDRAKGLWIGDRTAGAVAAALVDWAVLGDATMDSIAVHNRTYAQEHQDRARCLTAIEAVYAEARERHAARLGG